jgi:hypothetical protein
MNATRLKIAVLSVVWHLIAALLALGSGAIFLAFLAGAWALAIGLLATLSAFWFLAPHAWTTRNPATKPEVVVGRLFGRSTRISLRNLTFRYCFFGGLGVILCLVSFVAPPFVGIAMIMLTVPAILWTLPALFSRDWRRALFKLLRDMAMTAAVYGLLRGIGMVALYGLWISGTGPLVLDFSNRRPWEGLVFLRNPLSSSVDAALGLGAMILVSVLVIRDFFWRSRQIAQVENLATSKAASAALGLAEFKGVARPVQAGASPILSLSGSFFAIAFSADATKSSEVRQPFFLQDDSGQILVDPGAAKVWEGWASSLAHIRGAREIALRRRTRVIDANDSVVAELLPGDPVYVIGKVERQDDAGTGLPLLVVRPNPQPGVSEALKQALRGGRDIEDVFFLTDNDEISARVVLASHRKVALLVGLAWMILSALVFLTGLQGVEEAYRAGAFAPFLSSIMGLL